uniref:Nima-like ser/thr protein kinase n=1 Tax=Encephalitozoon cuniculi TaxID=6035 RepID=M1K623_ENCCN|nr:nima-like ser/thr protein kinase [Encephalitozoon cuniculi]
MWIVGALDFILDIHAVERFRFIRRLSRGAHGTVYLLETEAPTREKVACKSMLKRYRRYAEKEAEMLSSISHRRVVRLLDFFPTNSGLSIILEYLNYGSLHEMIEYLMENGYRVAGDLVWSVLAQAADGLRYLHSKQIIHRDVKPSNILMNRTLVQKEELLEFKLCDFSLAKNLCGKESVCGIVGTPSYMAPEVVSGERYSTSVDIWSLGISIYELLTLRRPFEGRTRDELFRMIVQGGLPHSICANREMERLVRRCLSRTNRISARAITSDASVRVHLRMLEAKLRRGEEPSYDTLDSTE